MGPYGALWGPVVPYGPYGARPGPLIHFRNVGKTIRTIFIFILFLK